MRALLAALILAVLPGAVAAQEQPQTNPVVIDGQTITQKDILAFMNGAYGSPRHPQARRIKPVMKEPEAMPSDAPFVSYQGRDPGPPQSQVIWMSTAESRAPDPRYEEEYVAAFALAVMDNGDGGPTLEALDRKTPRDRASRLALGHAFARAFKALSDRSEARAADQAAWIPEHVVPGATRAAAYRMLKSRGLTAYNWAFVKGKPYPGRGNPPVGAGCSMEDWSSGAWPYMNEPLPRQQGACAPLMQRKAMRNPDVELQLAGAFNMACGWTTHVDITFDRNDRVANVKVGKPAPGCI